MTEDEARRFPLAFQRVADLVKPERDANARQSIREFWWRFGWPRRELRDALLGISTYIATTETAKHRTFSMIDAAVAPDHMVVSIATDSHFVLGILSSEAHRTWSLAVGGTLEDRPRYNKSLCFDPFPFPDPAPALRTKIAEVANHLDTHRKAALARDERVTMTGMYNVVEKLRSDEALTTKERAIHEIAACGILRDLHDELDKLVAEAYGWPWPMEREEILERLVALHDERVEEEKRGIIRWLRPEYQIPRFAPEQAEAILALDESEKPAKKRSKKSKAADSSDEAPKPTATPWPATAVEQISAISALIAQQSRSAAEVAAAFAGARTELVTRHLDTLALMGEVTLGPDARYQASRKAA